MAKKAAAKSKLRCDDGTYDWVRATVDGDHVSLTYQATGLKVQGSDGFEDETLMDWSEDDIRKMVGGMLGIIEEDQKHIDVGYA